MKSGSGILRFQISPSVTTSTTAITTFTTAITASSTAIATSTTTITTSTTAITKTTSTTFDTNLNSYNMMQLWLTRTIEWTNNGAENPTIFVLPKMAFLSGRFSLIVLLLIFHPSRGKTWRTRASSRPSSSDNFSGKLARSHYQNFDSLFLRNHLFNNRDF